MADERQWFDLIVVYLLVALQLTAGNSRVSACLLLLLASTFSFNTLYLHETKFYSVPKKCNSSVATKQKNFVSMFIFVPCCDFLICIYY